MNGSLRQRGASSWELRVYDGTHPDTGKMRYATRTVRGSRREALAELEVFAAQVAKPRRQALDTTLGELFEQWYATAASGWAVNTQRQTLSVIKVHLVPRFGDLPVGQLTTANIDAFYAELRGHGGSDGRGLSDGTVHRIHGVLRRALTQAVRWEWVWTNPAEHACPPVARRREIFSPPPAAVARLLAATHDPRLLIGSGLAGDRREGLLVVVVAGDRAVEHQAGGESRAVRPEARGHFDQVRRGHEGLGVAVLEDVADLLGPEVPVDGREVETGAQRGPEHVEELRSVLPSMSATWSPGSRPASSKTRASCCRLD